MAAEQIKFAGEQGSLVIEISGYERPGAEDQDDANWLRSEVTIKIGPFSGAFKSAFMTYDLIGLHDRLKNGLAALSGTLSFQNTEHDIAFDIEFDKRGAATISGTAHPHRTPEASLKFGFDTDQSYLAQTLSQLEAVLRKFPVKQAQ
jgi:hypothetical protein